MRTNTNKLSQRYDDGRKGKRLKKRIANEEQNLRFIEDPENREPGGTIGLQVFGSDKMFKNATERILKRKKNKLSRYNERRSK